MAAPSQRSALGTLFAFLTALFGGIAWAAGSAGVWVVAVASAALAAWMATLSLGALRRRAR